MGPPKPTGTPLKGPVKGRELWRNSNELLSVLYSVFQAVPFSGVRGGIWHLFATATKLVLMGMSLKALKYICMHHLPCHCEYEWRKWEKWPFLIRNGQHSTVCGSGDMGLIPSTALCSWEAKFSLLQHYHSCKSWPCPLLLCFRGSIVCCCLLKSKKGAMLQIVEL